MVIEPSSACGLVNELQVIIIGDWGELIFDSQEAVAAAMGNWSEVNNPAWILSTGDNIYPKGIRSWDDIQVDLKWRNIYYQESIRDLVWFMSLGNHDYGDWVGEEWNQVELSRHEPRWYQPHLWYDHIEQLGDHSVHFVIIDTEAFRNRINNYTDMVDWMEVTLSQSTADWKLVIGHRHVFSAGDHGPVTTDLLENLVPIMEKYNVDAYVCGHDHNLQHMRNVSGEGMDYVLSGAGGAYPYRFNLQNAEYIRQVYGIETAFFDYTFGFVTLTSRKSELVFDYYNRDNEYIYSFTRRRPSVQH
jgi:predicted MPP superfamily phosphohydrolase